MEIKSKADIKLKVLNINDIIREAEPFDIILFSNIIFKRNRFSWTSFFVKLGSLSDWNHAALIMDGEPVNLGNANHKPKACDYTCKPQDTCKYIYEYAASKQPVTYTKLVDKLTSEDFKYIALIRFNKINYRIKNDPQFNAYSKVFVKFDFFLRMGCHSHDWENIKKDIKEKKPIKDGVSSKYTYNTTNIIHRTFLSFGLIFSLLTLVVSALAIFSIVSGNYLLWLLLLIAIILPSIILMEFINVKRYRNVIARRAICSGYPPEILSSIMFDPTTEQKQIEDFNCKWTQRTPPSPANLYANGASSDDCVIYYYKK